MWLDGCNLYYYAIKTKPLLVLSHWIHKSVNFLTMQKMVNHRNDYGFICTMLHYEWGCSRWTLNIEQIISIFHFFRPEMDISHQLVREKKEKIEKYFIRKAFEWLMF